MKLSQGSGYGGMLWRERLIGDGQQIKNMVVKREVGALMLSLGHMGVSLQEHIKCGWDVFSSFVSIEVGDGARTRFWYDIQCGERPLKETFPELFCIARNRDALVADHMLTHNGEVHWDMNFIRLVHNQEVDVVSSLFNVLYSVRLGWRMKISSVAFLRRDNPLR